MAAGGVLALSMALAACATDNSARNTGERLSDRGSEIDAYGTAWSEGQSDVRNAEKALKKSDRNRAKGERDLEQAREELAKAEQRISEASERRAAALKTIQDGKAKMTRAEAEYAETKAGPSALQPDD